MELIKELVGRKKEKNRIRRNSKYGKFIIQTNEVQLYLTWLLALRAVTHTKKFVEYLEPLSLGSIVRGFEICSNSDEKLLAGELNLYNKNRNKLAHKMYTENKLSETDCESSIKLGEKLLIKLKELIK